VLILIAVGSLVTSFNAGMAVPDWPLSFGSVNPPGWWYNFGVRLEHGHRLLAGCVGILVTGLCCSINGTWRPLKLALAGSFLGVCFGYGLGVSAPVRFHMLIWPGALGFFVGTLLWSSGDVVSSRRDRFLAVGVFLAVCVQAALGGLRVTSETAGSIEAAKVLRIIHGSVAEMFLIMLSALFGRLYFLGGRVSSLDFRPSRRISILAWVAVGGVYLQLLVGVALRHLGAGLAIPTFPACGTGGGLIPMFWSWPVVLSFVHTRVGASVVACIVCACAICGIRYSIGWLRWAHVCTLCLVICQIVVGISVIWTARSPWVASLHVVVGALLLCVLTLLAVWNSAVRGDSRQRGGGR
jgi:cytochrome c oxidase assembly protein subunit 15